ncbi:TVP38/TMEM64 family protein [Litorimonas cladophorae]|uniref:TVP38/TMEM64 family membrane protein n=1 Tax=Litorimonas cladophorae TaxID=1220491 RepID=A0A918KEN8_9PROT|nr:VTT domain-containing protein [Litorimonas cladophorae]GGX60585.1 TVP38/TMEM64 family protein [Litorimonas cladophorae]
MNKRATIWLIVSLLTPVLLVLLAKQFLGVNQSDFIEMMTSLRDSPWAVPITIGLFCGLAFIGAPQWMLVTGAVVAFGPWEGSLLAWIGSLAAASLGFWVGHLVGAERLQRIDAQLIQKLSAAVRKNGFMTSLVIRLVPTGPAILVNLAAGVSRMKFSHFATGTAIGIVPKIVVIAMISQGIISGLSGSVMAIIFAALAVVAIGVSWLARKRLEARSSL